ncbi:hypothetical protein BWQ96_03734 [Gracilariopsis chorda]|uniref:Uncharacterized protein n=1 Tax=Gracilariopsis chorda TaxID=448386 RepID=A0A2V3IWM6_9FLOR|nr:hypothetical protein BWQ96_03734 [Gracilariopsis chorda]|eukprot:PXF46499.1 hypothetical protein BWQ96_03734 [Gracilariopsis chorda]
MNGPERPECPPPSQLAPKTNKRPHQGDKTSNLTPISKRRTDRKVSLRNKTKGLGTNLNTQGDSHEVDPINRQDEEMEDNITSIAANTVPSTKNVQKETKSTSANNLPHVVHSDIVECTIKNNASDTNMLDVDRNSNEIEVSTIDVHDKENSADENPHNEDSGSLLQDTQSADNEQAVTKSSGHSKARKQNWTLTDEVLADLKCAYCEDIGSVRPSGQNRNDPYRGPALKCKLCTRRFQGRSVMNLLHAAAHSPVVFSALRTAEECIQENKKQIAAQKEEQKQAMQAKKSKEQPPDWIQIALRDHKHKLRCPNCQAQGKFTLHGRSKGLKVLRCTECKTTQPGDAADSVMSKALGSDWQKQITRGYHTLNFTDSIQEHCFPSPSSRKATPCACTQESAEIPPISYHDIQNKIGLQISEEERQGQRQMEEQNGTDRTSRMAINETEWAILVETIKDLKTTVNFLKHQNKVLTEKLAQLTSNQTATTNHDTPLHTSGPRTLSYTKEWPTLHALQHQHESENKRTEDLRLQQQGGNTKTWSSIVRQERMSKLPDEQRMKIHQTLQAIEISNLRMNTAPEVDVVYIKGLKRSPYGLIRRSLQHSIPRSSLLGLSYIGGSILEIITLKSHKHRLIETLQLLGLQHMANFSIRDDAMKKQGENSDKKTREMQNLTRLIRRMQRCVRNSKNPLATRWYAARLQEVNKRMTELDAKISDKRTKDTASTQITEAPTAVQSVSADADEVVQESPPTPGCNNVTNTGSIEPKPGQTDEHKHVLHPEDANCSRQDTDTEMTDRSPKANQPPFSS